MLIIKLWLVSSLNHYSPHAGGIIGLISGLAMDYCTSV